MSKEKTPQRIMRELSQPFKMTSLEWRVQQVGITRGNPWARVLAYVTSRDMQQRLDDVIGIFAWKNEFTTLPNSVGDGAMCGASIKFDGEWITKWNGAENTKIEPIKGGLSSAEKRAWVEWGIGRYLYDVEAMFADCKTNSAYQSLKKDEKQGYEKADHKIKEYAYNKMSEEEKKNYTYQFTSKGESYRQATIWWKPPTLDPKYRPQPYVTKTTKDQITTLSEETKTDLKELLSHHIGVESIHDLYQNETGKVVDFLIKVKQKQEEEKKDEK